MLGTYFSLGNIEANDVCDLRKISFFFFMQGRSEHKDRDDQLKVTPNTLKFFKGMLSEIITTISWIRKEVDKIK